MKYCTVSVHTVARQWKILQKTQQYNLKGSFILIHFLRDTIIATFSHFDKRTHIIFLCYLSTLLLHINQRRLKNLEDDIQGSHYLLPPPQLKFAGN